MQNNLEMNIVEVEPEVKDAAEEVVFDLDDEFGDADELQENLKKSPSVKAVASADEEEWRPIEGYANYMVSSYGNVKNANKKASNLLKPSNNGGYLQVGLSQNSKRYCASVHQLVARAFIPNPENKDQINHKDKNPLNNHVSNLEWCTALENNRHRSDGVKQTTNQNVRIWRVDAKTNEKLELYNSINDAALWVQEQKLTNVEFAHIRAHLSANNTGKLKTGYGYKWEKDVHPDLEGEIWKPVVINNVVQQGYFISNLGRLKDNRGKIRNGYKCHHSGEIVVRVNSSRKVENKYSIQKLVALAFIPNPLNKPCICHLDGDKTNNRVENLQWSTPSEICHNNVKKGLITHHKRKIGQYDLNDNLIQEFDSIKEATDATKVSTIKNVLYKRQNTGGGFLWKYLD